MMCFTRVVLELFTTAPCINFRICILRHVFDQSRNPVEPAATASLQQPTLSIFMSEPLIGKLCLGDVLMLEVENVA